MSENAKHPITIIVTDGYKSALFVDGKRINGISALSFRHSGCEKAEIDISFADMTIAPSPVQEELLAQASKQIGQHLRTE